MITISIPMWTEDRTLVPMISIIELFDDNEFTWEVLSFDGAGTFPNGSTWAEFQDQVDRGKASFTWPGIREFARNLNQVYEGEIVASSATAEGHHVIEIEIFDSTEYNVSFDPSLIDQKTLRSRIMAIES